MVEEENDQKKLIREAAGFLRKANEQLRSAITDLKMSKHQQGKLVERYESIKSNIAILEGMLR